MVAPAIRGRVTVEWAGVAYASRESYADEHSNKARLGRKAS
jgi:hypothetical protein